MPRNYDPKADIGVTKVGLFVLETFRWIFREQPKNDYGIDAHVEVCIGSEPSGRMVALQIKTGASYFDEPTDGGWVFRFEEKHRSYWLFGSLPVLVVLYDVEASVGYWQVISDSTADRAGGSWKVVVPRENTLDHGFGDNILRLSEGPEWLQRFRQLALARSWLEILADGKQLVVEFSDKINTMVPRGSFTIWSGRRRLKEWPFYVRGYCDHTEILAEAFPWADAEIDEDHEEQKIEDLWEAECSYGDGEGGVYHTTSMEDFAERVHGMDPDEWSGQEFSTKRYFLELNDFGESFLSVYDHLHGRQPRDFSERRMARAEREAQRERWAERLAELEADPEYQRRRFIKRAACFNFRQIDYAATCTVRVIDGDDPDLEKTKECGRAIPPGDGFVRYESNEGREVIWCWSCLSGILWAE